MFAELVFYALICVTVSYAFYKWATMNNDYFKERNLKYLKPKFLVGNTLGLFLNRYEPFNYINKIYFRKEFKNEKYEDLFIFLVFSLKRM